MPKTTHLGLCGQNWDTVSGFQSPQFFNFEPHWKYYLRSQFWLLEKPHLKWRKLCWWLEFRLSGQNSLYTISKHQTEVGLNQMRFWIQDFHNSPMKWLCPKASISSKRTRPPGVWRRVTLRPSMREHCWNPVAVTFHSKISEAVASWRILKMRTMSMESPLQKNSS